MKPFQAEGPGWRLTGEILPILTAATHTAGIHPVGTWTLTGTPPAEPIRLSIPDAHLDLTVPTGSRAGAPLPAVTPQTAAALERVNARCETELRVSQGDRELARVPVTLLPPWHWPHARAARLSSASLVVPGDGAVSRAVVETSRGVGGSADALTKTRAETVAVLRALYDHLSSCDLVYDRSRVDADPWSGGTSQRVRAPQEILGAVEAGSATGNCLDLTLLFAGALESLGQDPLLFFVGSLDEPPPHAFIGVWRTPGERFRPVHTDAAGLARRVARDEILPLETTGVCRGEPRLSFEQACRAARERFERGEPLHAVDVSAARPPRGHARPLIASLGPLAQRARWLGEEFVRERGLTHIETTDLLLGLCAAGGDLATWLLTASGSSPARVKSVIESSRGQSKHPDPPRPTRNLELCLETARANARAAARSVVEESDLLWAVLENPSENVGRVLAAAGCPLQTLKARLEGRVARVYEQSVFRDPASGMFPRGDEA